MRKLLLLFFVLFGYSIKAQITTSPGTPTISDEIIITLNTTGTELENYTGDIYAHTGVTVDGSQWQNVIGSWGNNSTQPKFTKTADNTYELTISNNVYDYYNVDNSKEITEINLVARSADGSQQTRPDYHITIFSNELNIQITAPNADTVFDLNASTDIMAETTLNADLELFVNNSSIETATNVKSISKNYTFSTSGQHTIKATASTGSTQKETTINVYVKTPTVTETRPNGVKNGVTVNSDNTVTFVLLAPQKSDVFLIGEFNNWALHEDYQMKKDGEYFWITLDGLDESIEYAYQYFIDYEKKVADPYAEKVLDESNDQYISASNYPNLKEFPSNASGIVSTFKINETDYTWQNTSFTKPAKEELIIYELLVRDFSEDDSFQSVINKLDYLKSLGINALELMPINEFEGNDSWGYNVSHFFALDKAYGTKNKFKELVDKCHQKGIAVIVDVVFNHSYSQCPLLEMYDFNVSNGTTTNNPFYNNDHNFENGALRFGFDFDHESTYTQQYFKDVMSYWINEYKIDGYRFDFTKGFTNTFYPTSGDQWGNAYNQDRIDRLTDYANYVWNEHSNDFYVILEHLADNSEEKALANAGMMLWGKMTHNYNQNTMGYDSDADIAWGYYKNRDFTSPHLITYMESHDEERLMYKNLQYGNANGDYSVKNLNTALNRQELAGLFFFTIPGPKMIWQFGELGYDISIDENGRTGRKPIKWEYYSVTERKSIYDTWATLIALRKEHDVFSTEDVTMDVSGLAKRINLNHTSNNVVIIGNFDVVEKNINPNFASTGTWYEFFTDSNINVTNTTEPITLQPGEYRLYSTTAFQNPLSNGPDVSFSSNSVILYPTPASDEFLLNQEASKVRIYELSGKLIKEFKGDFTSNQNYSIDDLNSGLYIVEVELKKKKRVVKKLIKK
ncbi:alpha-amylase family glycosyl hydrolase [Tenacibaculum xiamenense]|uniref:alpha-amylase family glycosyl hydrolase n=1 Tax=Tenacibaculum xiamenense TaxID=1261553 RepID=UPI0038938CCF